MSILYDMPDYLINSVLTVPIGASIEFEGNAIVAFGDEGGLILEGDNTITASNGSVTFKNNATGWKGIWNKGTSTFSGSFIITGAGASVFEGKEAAAIVSDGPLTLGFTTFTGNSGYDLLINDAVTSLSLSGIVFGSPTPFKIPFSLINSFNSISAEFPDEALITFTANVDVQQSTTENNYSYDVKSDILITGGLHVNSKLIFSNNNGNHTLFMQENTSLIASFGIQVTGSSESVLTITGQDNKNWNGIYLGGGTTSLEDVTIKNAGANPISSISITGITEKASVYVNGALDGLKDATITDGGGYGVYVASFGTLSGPTGGESRYTRYTISNHAMPAISAPIHQSTYMVEDVFTISAVPDGIAAVDVRNSSSSIPNNSTLKGLGTGNYYLFEGDLNVGDGSVNTTLTIGAGAHLKFNTDKKIFVNGSATLTATGTAEDPIIFDGVTDWAGVLAGGSVPPSTILSANCSFDYVTIQKGGSTEMAVGANKGGIYIQTSGTLSFTNCTFKDNTGYGAILQSNSTVFAFKDIANSNTFSGNTLGDLEDNATDSDGDGIPDSGEIPACVLDPNC